MKPLLLTIAIPTYDRFQALRQTLEIIIPQLREQVELTIIDNASPCEIKDMANEISSRHQKNPHVTLHRNQCNIGGNANILRCIEMARGDWVWILGDDDEPSTNAINILLEKITSPPKATTIYIGYSSSRSTIQESAILTSENLAEDCLFDTYTFISNGIYRTSEIKKELSIGFDNCYACAPHFAMLLSAAYSNGASVELEPKLLVNFKSSEAEKSYSYERIKLRFITLLELPFLSTEGRKRLSQGINKATFPTCKTIIFDIINTCITENPKWKSWQRYHISEYFARNNSLAKKKWFIKTVARALLLVTKPQLIQSLISKGIRTTKLNGKFKKIDPHARI